MSERDELGRVLDTAWANLEQTNGTHPAEFINAHIFSSIAKSLYVLARIEVLRLADTTETFE